MLGFIAFFSVFLVLCFFNNVCVCFRFLAICMFTFCFFLCIICFSILFCFLFLIRTTLALAFRTTKQTQLKREKEPTYKRDPTHVRPIELVYSFLPALLGPLAGGPLLSYPEANADATRNHTISRTQSYVLWLCLCIVASVAAYTPPCEQQKTFFDRSRKCVAGVELCVLSAASLLI